jgi:hypothetical protein
LYDTDTRNPFRKPYDIRERIVAAIIRNNAQKDHER